MAHKNIDIIEWKISMLEKELKSNGVTDYAFKLISDIKGLLDESPKGPMVPKEG